jgi:hypothetical protein
MPWTAKTGQWASVASPGRPSSSRSGVRCWSSPTESSCVCTSSWGSTWLLGRGRPEEADPQVVARAEALEEMAKAAAHLGLPQGKATPHEQYGQAPRELGLAPPAGRATVGTLAQRQGRPRGNRPCGCASAHRRCQAARFAWARGSRRALPGGGRAAVAKFHDERDNLAYRPASR